MDSPLPLTKGVALHYIPPTNNLQARLPNTRPGVGRSTTSAAKKQNGEHLARRLPVTGVIRQ
eukprot:4877-Eustigmatos_ZCMA.PRE.1